MKWYRKNFDERAVLSEGYNSDFDIISEKGSVEVKEDRLAHQTGNYAIEFKTHDGKDSGIMGTKADFFVLVDWEYVVFCSTKVLRDLITSIPYKKEVEMGEKFSDGKNGGYLIPRDKILNNPMFTVLERWFPVIR